MHRSPVPVVARNLRKLHGGEDGWEAAGCAHACKVCVCVFANQMRGDVHNRGPLLFFQE